VLSEVNAAKLSRGKISCRRKIPANISVMLGEKLRCAGENRALAAARRAKQTLPVYARDRRRRMI
jgi:hypothetical protein